VDFHFQSVSTLSSIIDEVVGEARGKHGEVWVITGRGVHVDGNSFQKQVRKGRGRARGKGRQPIIITFLTLSRTLRSNVGGGVGEGG